MKHSALLVCVGVFLSFGCLAQGSEEGMHAPDRGTIEQINSILIPPILHAPFSCRVIAEWTKILEDPEQYNSRMRLGFAYAAVHRYPEAESEFRKAEMISPGSVYSLGALAYVYGLEGKKSQAEKMLPEIEAQAVKSGHPWMVVRAYVGLDRKDEALRWLEKASKERDRYFSLRDPLVDPLRADPRFQDLERRVKMGLPVHAVE